VGGGGVVETSFRVRVVAVMTSQVFQSRCDRSFCDHGRSPERKQPGEHKETDRSGKQQRDRHKPSLRL
jgi:hypothetical protein